MSPSPPMELYAEDFVAINLDVCHAAAGGAERQRESAVLLMAVVHVAVVSCRHCGRRTYRREYFVAGNRTSTLRAVGAYLHHTMSTTATPVCAAEPTHFFHAQGRTGSSNRPWLIRQTGPIRSRGHFTGNARDVTKHFKKLTTGKNFFVVSIIV